MYVLSDSILKVAFAGEAGAYSELAAREYFEEFGSGRGRLTTVAHSSFAAVFAAVASARGDAGIIPIENSIAGSIHHNYDLLLAHSLSIVGEYHLHVSHCLVGKPGAKLKQIRTVYSHPQALAQCEDYLASLNGGVKTVPTGDTAASVKQLRQSGKRSEAAVASREAAAHYDMSVLAEAIEDDPANYTRFLVIAKRAAHKSGDGKTSIVFTLKNVPGALYKALGVFAKHKVDLTKIESRPLIGKPWEYLFYADFRGYRTDPSGRGALKALKAYTTMINVLGSYPRHEYVVRHQL